MTDPDGATPGTCRSCGAAIWWLPTARGETSMPVDRVSRLDGNLVLEAGRVVRFRVDDLLHAGLPRYVSHFATCPDAPLWRKARAAKGEP